VAASVKTGVDLVEACRALRPDLVVADVCLPGLDGVAAAEAVCGEASAPFVLVSAYDPAELAGRAAACPAVMAFLPKPVDETALGVVATLARRRFEQFRTIAAEAEGLRQALADRKVIEQAKGVLTRWVGLEEEVAFRRLQDLASRNNIKLVAAALLVRDAAEAFRPAGNRAGPPRQGPRG
jgi:response regulator NasT